MWSEKTMDIEDDLKEIREKDLTGGGSAPPHWQKLIAIASAIFLVILITFYFVPGSYVLDILEGRLVSEKLNPDFSINLKNGGKVIFEKAAYEQLRKFYFAEQKNEFKACLLGKKEGGDYFVSGLYLPKTFGQSVSHVSAELCSKETIISLHTHPYAHCIFSPQDIKSYGAVRKINPSSFIGLMCGPDRFSFYGF